jgi:hypothetical protein
MSTNWPAINRIILAEHLRRYASISRIKYEKKIEDQSISARAHLDEQKQQFVLSQYTENEFEALEHRILETAKRGDYEVEVMRFHSAYCTDGGRAINNSEKAWPETLLGKARDFYLIWKEHGNPKGYRMTAKIMNFPKGFMGDVGIFIDWS